MSPSDPQQSMWVWLMKTMQCSWAGSPAVTPPFPVGVFMSDQQQGAWAKHRPCCLDQLPVAVLTQSRLCALQVSVIDQQQEAKVSHAMRVTPGYGQVEQGPPVNLSGGNVDRTAFLQASLIRDTTYQYNQSPLGARDIFTVGCQPHCRCHVSLCEALPSEP